MLVTSREQKLIQAFVKEGILTMAEMLELTGTSRRTLYRDLEGLAATLPAGIRLTSSEAGYSLDGDLSRLTTRELVDFTLEERLCGELVLLVTDGASIRAMTERFGISQPTATGDLRRLDSILAESGLRLSRERGLTLVGPEEAVRSLLVAVLRATFPIETVVTGDLAGNKLLPLFDDSAFTAASRAFDATDLPGVTDKTRALMQFFLASTLLRIAAGHSVEASDSHHPSKKAIDFVNALIQAARPQAFTIAEITYLATIYDVLYFGYSREVLFTERFDADFSYKIRQLIDEVSGALHIEFGKDDRLYGLLYAHLKGTDILPELFGDKENAFVKKIISDDARIFEAVAQALPAVFGKKMSKNETAFVSLHFAATLERSDLVLPLTAAIVTSRGRISIEFLISNLKKNFPFLRKIDIVQASTTLEKSSYDVIFTTERALSAGYIYIETTQDQASLDSVRHRLRAIQQALAIAPKKPPAAGPEAYINLNQLFTVGNIILEHFTVQKIARTSNLTDMIEQMVALVKFDAKEELVKKLQTRFDETHLAIPDTELALFHAVHPTVATPYFGIFDLAAPIDVTGMDGSTIAISRALLLLSPPDVGEEVAYLLGKITSSIIENKLYMTIYNSGNVAVVTALLRQIMTDAIRNYGV